ncbi:MAG TPA: tripartite tricarboxylate transporter substrate-binding protein [Pseudolabrys sp.]|nr:tripartite tricarboxylate transporter substrate-binding protein [Pseudolabrys sp.]
MRRQLAPILAAVIATLLFSTSTGRADEWPTRPIRVIVPLSAGSAADVVPRIVFEQVSAQLGQPVVVENRPGASGTIGARAVAEATPDGYTLLAHSSAHVIAKSTVANIPYDPVRDFAAVAPLGNLPNVLVISPEKKIKTLKDLVARGQNEPVTFGSIGVGSPITLAMERLRLSAKFRAQPITFKGAPEAMLEVMTGRVDVYYAPVSVALSMISSGKLLPLTVSSPTRVAALPDVPTTIEAGYPNSSYQFWLGVFAPAKTPSAIVDRLNSEIEKALQTPAVRAKLEKLGVQPMMMKPASFAEFVKAELTANMELAKEVGILPQ